jgi:hypothetical protein
MINGVTRLEADGPPVLGEEQRSILLRDYGSNCRDQWRNTAAEEKGGEAMRAVRENSE